MTDNAQRQTAKIIQFPVKAHAAKLGHQASGRKVAELPARVAPVEFGSGWYHDDAIREAEQIRRR
jgi:Protein of unknown function (DUF2735)